MSEPSPDVGTPERGHQWPWSARLALSAVVLVLLDSLIALDFGAFGASLGLGISLGAILGGLLDLGGLGLRRLPRKAVLPLFPVVLSLAGLFLARATGAFQRLDGEYAMLAWAVLLSCGFASLFGGLLLASLQPTSTDPRGLVSRFGQKWRVLLAAIMALGVIALFTADRVLFVGLYPIAHTALRLAALALGGALLSLLGGWRPHARSRVILALLLVAPTFGTFATLHNAPQTLATLNARFGLSWLDTLRSATDFDGDGFSSLLTGGDLAAFDASVTLMAPSEGIAGPTLADVELYPGEQPSPLSVVFVSIDTLRADRLGAYGHKRPTSPNIDAFAERGTLFESAYTAGTFTSLAMSAAHRGVYPRRLRWTRLLETNKYRLLRASEQHKLREGEKPNHWFGLPIDDPRPTLAQRLQARGMATLAVIDDGFSQFFHPKLGAANGFDIYKSVDDLPKKKRSNYGTTELALETLSEAPEDKPFFMWVHYFGAHRRSARKLPGPKNVFGKSLSQRYDHVVMHTDRAVGPFLEALEALQAKRPLLVVITSDHGETMGRRNRYHGTRVTVEQTRIPLIFVGPGFRPKTKDRRVASIVDIMPTILAATETPVGKAVFDGIDLAKESPPKRVVFAETWRYRADQTPKFDWVAALDGRKMLALDRRRNLRKTTKLGDRRKKLATPEHLELSLDRYLLETRGGVIDWHD